MKADYVHKDSRTLEEKPQVFTRWIDTTIEELKQENKLLKEQVDYLKRSIERKEETIIDLQNERVPYTNEYVAKLENQQKEFVKYLENEKVRLARECSHTCEDSLGKTRFVNEDIFNEVDKNLSKYQEIIGGKE